MLKKILVTIIAAIMAICSFVGCGGDTEDYGGRTVLKVGIFNGGWGMTWLETAAEKFEEKNPQYKVLVTGDKTFTMQNLLGTIDAIPQDMFVGAPCYLYDYVSQDKLMDVTDIMTTPLNQQGIGVTDEESIADKMWSDLDEFYKGYNNSGRYYAAPFGGGIRAISYDIDLFEDEALYYDADGGWTSGLTANGAAAKSVGQDGVAGTYDDGLPVTEAEFWGLCDYMVTKNIIPFIWSDQTQYTNNFIYSIVASYEGKENFDLIKTMNGTYTFAGDTEPTTITPQNAYKLVGMDGRRAALNFAKTLVSNNDYYHQQSGTASMGFMTAQSEYLLSVESAKLTGAKRIAFIIDGSHWLNEATDTFNDMAAMSSEYANRRLGVMPFPTFAGQKATKTTYFASSFYTSTFIRKNAKEAEAAKKFFAYLHSDEALQICTQESGMPRAMDYDMTNAQLNTMNTYYQTLWGAWKGNSDIVYHTCNNEYIYRNEQFFEGDWKWNATTSDGKVLNDPITAFKTYKSLTVDDYLTALKNTITESAWRSQLGF